MLICRSQLSVGEIHHVARVAATVWQRCGAVRWADLLRIVERIDCNAFLSLKIQQDTVYLLARHVANALRKSASRTRPL